MYAMTCAGALNYSKSFHLRLQNWATNMKRKPLYTLFFMVKLGWLTTTLDAPSPSSPSPSSVVVLCPSHGAPLAAPWRVDFIGSHLDLRRFSQEGLNQRPPGEGHSVDLSTAAMAKRWNDGWLR